MELLTTALVIVLLTTASAKPTGWHRHYDADITDNDWMQGLLDRWSWWYTESSSYEHSSESDQSLESWESSESSESQSSEESSEEVLIPDPTTPVMTTETAGDETTLTPEPDTMSTGEPGTVTPPPATTPTPVTVTSTNSVTHCVTEIIPTAAPITENRGDN